MATPIDPYHDEDAEEFDAFAPMQTSLSPKNDTGFATAFKHMGDAFKNGGFCSPRAKEKTKVEEMESKAKIDSKADLTSLSDESHRSHDDATRRGIVKTVTFSNEPLIVDDEPESDGTKEQDAKEYTTKTCTKSTTSRFTSLLFAFFFMCTMAASTFAFYKIEFSDLDEIIRPIIGKINNHVETATIKFEASDIDMTSIASGALGFIILLATIRSPLITEKSLKSLIEFSWGIVVYGIVIIGVYYTYDIFSN